MAMARPGVKLRATVPRLDGVDLKAAEHVTRRLLHGSLAPSYSLLPPLPSLRSGPNRAAVADFLASAAPFHGLPRAVDPASQGTDGPTGRPYGVPQGRAARKREQIACVVRAALVVVLGAARAPGRVLDLCGGCGHVGLVLAALLPDWEVVVVDAKPFSLRVAESRAAEAGLRNIVTREMDINDIDESERFDLAVALHACGEASDIVLEKAMAAGAAAVVAPCCVGGVVSVKSRGVPGVASAADLGSAWGLPRSLRYRDELEDDEYRLIARAADYGEDLSSGDWWRRAAKSMVEGDRLAWVDANNFHTRLVKMRPLSCTPKNDMLLVWPHRWSQRSEPGEQMQFEGPWEQDEEANGVIASVIGENGLLAGFDVTQVAAVERQLRADVCAPSSSGEAVFHGAQGSRRRKLVHAVAGSLGLHHESVGHGPERHVVVRRSADWPFYFHGYLAFSGPWATSVARLLADVPASHALRRAETRGDRAPHITLVTAKEVRLLPGGMKYNTGLLLSTARRRLVNSVPKLVGLGRVVDAKDSDNDAYFAVVEWPEAWSFRNELRLPTVDFHITLGFAKTDIHNVRKDSSTLLETSPF